MKNILKTLIPGTLICVLAVIVPFVLMILEQKNVAYFNVSSYFQAIGIAIVAFVITSLIVIGRIFWPFNKYKFRIFAFIVIAYIGLILLTLAIQISEKGSLFGLLFVNLTIYNYFVAAVTTAVLCTLYIGIIYLTEVARKGNINENIQ